MKELTKTKNIRGPQIGWIVTALDSITKNTIMVVKAGIVNPANPPELLKSVVVNMSSCFLIPHLKPRWGHTGYWLLQLLEKGTP